MGRVISSACNRGVNRLMMSCLAENRTIQAIVREYEAQLAFEQGNVVDIITPDTATYLSRIEQGLGDEFDFMIAVLNLSAI